MADNKLPTDTEIDVNKVNIAESPRAGIGKLFGKVTKKWKVFLPVLILLVVSFAVLFLLRQPKPGPRTAAREAARGGDLKSAEQNLNRALAADENNPQLLAAMVKAIALQGNASGSESESFEKAKPYLDKALENDSEDLEVLLSAGYLHETNGDYQKAYEYYDKAVNLHPESSMALFHKGHALDFLGKREEATLAYNQALQIDENNAFALMGRANNLARSGNAEAAFDSYRKASEVPNLSKTTRAEALTGTAITLSSNLLKLSDAIDYARRATEEDPNYSPGLAAYGHLLSINGNPQEGVEYLRRSIEKNPRITRNYYQLAQVLRANKVYADAINYQKQAIAGVENDNTLLDFQEKKIAKARYTYDLAKTYDMSKIQTDIYPLLAEAVEINPLIKDVIKNDLEKYGFFESISTDPRFIQLVGTQ
jgi:tetratricopeptide (TPR) repeat protein